MPKLETAIPFAGFYETLHHENVCDAASYILFGKNYEDVEDKDLDAVWDYIRVNKLKEEYCRQYLKCMSKEYGFKSLEFKEMTSPREYNFTTDRIFAMIDTDELKAIIGALDRTKLAERIVKKHSSCPGFCSFVSNKIETWDLEGMMNLDCWQIETILEEYISENYKGHDHWRYDLAVYCPESFEI